MHGQPCSQPIALTAFQFRHVDNTYLHFWRHSWKTQLMDRILADSHGVFVDVGVNTGHTLIDYYAARVRKGYIGFEPNPHCVERANAIISASGLTDCTLIPAGLAGTNALMTLHLHGGMHADTGAALITDLRRHRR